MEARLVLDVYRVLMRAAGRLRGDFVLRSDRFLPLSDSRMAPAGSEYARMVLQQSLNIQTDKLVDIPGDGVFDAPGALRTFIRHNFKANKAVDTGSQQGSQLMDGLVRSLRFANDQVELQGTSALTRDKDMMVDATSQYLGSITERFSQNHRFLYRIRITNMGKDPIHVSHRRWRIFAASPPGPAGQEEAHMLCGMIPETAGGWASALVGKQPVLSAGECFEYCSSAVIPRPRGHMKGALLVHKLEPSSMQRISTFELDLLPLPLIASE